MSGLLGLVDLSGAPIQPELLRSLAEAAAYRGPGGITCQIVEGAGLAHFALHAADRPVFGPRISILFDGRLDNRPELIARLAPARGPETSDAELVLAAYLEWGDGCPGHLLGDFAFAVWDAPRRRLLCAVDPLGIKPLHWARAGSALCFASDAVMVLRHPEVPDGYDEVEIGAYLTGRCEGTERSFFSAIRKLAPGHLLVAEDHQVRVRGYWSPNPREIRYSRDEDYATHLREILERSVADRLRDGGDCVGIAMSGGLDSTSLAALALRVPGGNVRAYTFAFDHLAQCDERTYSQAMTEELGLETEPVHAEELWRLESGKAVPFSPDTPFLGWRTCYQEILHRLAARRSRVLLLGHGGDDLLRGSSLVYAERLRRGDPGAVREVFRHARDRRELWIRTFYRFFGKPFLPAAANRLLRSATGIEPKNSPPPWLQSSFVRRVDLEARDELFVRGPSGGPRARRAGRFPIISSPRPGTGASSTGTSGPRPPWGSRCGTRFSTAACSSSFSPFQGNSSSGWIDPRISCGAPWWRSFPNASGIESGRPASPPSWTPWSGTGRRRR